MSGKILVAELGTGSYPNLDPKWDRKVRLGMILKFASTDFPGFVYTIEGNNGYNSAETACLGKLWISSWGSKQVKIGTKLAQN